jgi:hypothetical protein
MGDAANMILNGILNENGEYNPSGYFNYQLRSGSGKRPNHVGQVNRFLNSKHLNPKENGEHIVREFLQGIPEQDRKLTVPLEAASYGRMCRSVCQTHWKSFSIFLKQNNGKVRS